MPKRQRKLGFMVRVQVWPGSSPHEHAAFMRHWEDYCVEHELSSLGGPIGSVVWAEDREIAPTDQVDLMLWLLDQRSVSGVSVSALDGRVDEPEMLRALPVVHARFGDLTVIPLTWLYRARRIDARQFIDILGGHSCTAQLH